MKMTLKHSSANWTQLRKENKFENVSVETSQTETQKGKRMWENMEWNIQEMWDNYNRLNICMMEYQEKKTESNTRNIGTNG